MLVRDASKKHIFLCCRLISNKQLAHRFPKGNVNEHEECQSETGLPIYLCKYGNGLRLSSRAFSQEIHLCLSQSLSHQDKASQTHGFWHCIGHPYWHDSQRLAFNSWDLTPVQRSNKFHMSWNFLHTAITFRVGTTTDCTQYSAAWLIIYNCALILHIVTLNMLSWVIVHTLTRLETSVVN